MTRGRLLQALVLIVGGTGAPLRAQDPGTTTRPVSDENSPPLLVVDRPQLLAPTFGRPVFVEPGGTLTVFAEVPPGQKAQLTLIAPGTGGRRIPIPEDVHPATSRPAGTPASEMSFRLPADLSPGLYDLALQSGALTTVARHCVAVAAPRRRVRLIHLSDMNLGDVASQRLDPRLIDELNLLQPTLIIATGDYLDATHPDPERGWRELIADLCRFDAPLLMACGDHDDLALYSRHVAPSPSGVVSLGELRFLVAYDLPSRPLTEDPGQLRWLRQTLANTGGANLSVLVSHDSTPNLLNLLAENGSLAATLKAGRLGLAFVGGHRDAVPAEQAAAASRFAPLVLARTHQSSPVPRGGADGVSRYRVIDLDGSRAFYLGAGPGADDLPPATPVGRLTQSTDVPNDGTSHTVRVNIANQWPYPIRNLGTRVRVAKNGTNPPASRGAELIATIDAGEFWDCRIAFDLPDKGTLQAIVSTNPLPPEPHLQVRFDLPPKLRLQRVNLPAGSSFLEAAEGSGRVQISNTGTETATVTARVRLDGQVVAFAVDADNRPPAAACRLSLPPGTQSTLRLDISASTFLPGPRTLQVILDDGTAWSPVCHTLELSVQPAR